MLLQSMSPVRSNSQSLKYKIEKVKGLENLNKWLLFFSSSKELNFCRKQIFSNS